MENNLRVVTVATKYEGYLKSLEYTLNGNLDIVGLNMPWNGFISKLVYLNEYLKTIQDDTIVVFVDAYDVLFNRDYHSLEELANEFEKMNTDILFSCTDFSSYNIVSYYYMREMFIGVCGSTLSCNGGLYMGKCKSLRLLIGDALDLALKINETDDERLINMLLNLNCKIIGYANDDYFRLEYKNDTLISIDVDNKIFNNHISSNIYTTLKENYKPPINILDSGSYFYHFIANQDIDHICDRHNIIYDKQHKRCNTNIKKISHYYKYFKIELFILFIIIIILIYLNFR